MTNREIVEQAAVLYGLQDKTLKTYNEWKRCGYQVKRGEKAALKVDLWLPRDRRHVQEKEEEDGEHKPGFFQKTVHLFTEDQVKPL